MIPLRFLSFAGVLLLAAVAMLPAVPGGAVAASLSAAPRASSQTPDVEAVIVSLWPDAEAQGISRAVFDAAFAGVRADPSVTALTRRQPEFAVSLGHYLATQVTPGRIATGRVMLARWGTVLAEIERRYGVPPAIVVAIWGLETGYGASAGDKDVIRSMVTLAAAGIRPALYRTELLAALALLQDGRVSRDRLRGSWAGAMGQPQFMPSSFRAFAVDQDGDGTPDIWTSIPDALASIANFIRSKGWQSDRPWGLEVTLPAGFDLRESRAEWSAWAARGVVRADGGAFPPGGEAILLFPAGAGGPAFLVTANFEVLKTYNFSDAYVLSVGHLADRMTGGVPLKAAWPADPPMSRDDRIALQTRLVDLGYAVDNREARISLALRDVIRAAQISVGRVPDGHPTVALLTALRSAPAKP